VRSPAWLRAAVAAAVLAVLLSGCKLQLRAETLKIEVDDDGMRLVEPADGRFHGGETVIEIVNGTSSKRQFTLARTAAPVQALPHGILTAYSYRDDSQVVAVTGVLRAAELQLQFGSIPRPQPTKTKIHVFLHADTPYLLFDRLGGYRHGVALELEATR
jgi:hypothetical protein